MHVAKAILLQKLTAVIDFMQKRVSSSAPTHEHAVFAARHQKLHPRKAQKAVLQAQK